MTGVIEKRWEAHGMECAVIYVNGSHRCGYVLIPEEHPYHGKDTSEGLVDVHGGVTWAGPVKVLGDGFWLGFDCAHLGDRTSFDNYGHLWTEQEVEAETERMAKLIGGAV